MANEKRLIAENDIYALFAENGTARLHVGDIDVLPRVDAVEVVHGRWIEEREIPSYSNKNIPVVECSRCRCFFCDIINVHSFMYHFCPHCGAKMDGGNEDG